MKHLARLAAAVCGLVVALSAPSAVSAHSELDASVPADGDSVTSPDHVELVFSDALDPALVRVDLTGPAGEQVATELAFADASRVAFAPVSMLSDGIWVASWSAMSPDGHVVDGVFSFTVSNLAPATPDTALVDTPDNVSDGVPADVPASLPQAPLAATEPTPLPAATPEDADVTDTPADPTAFAEAAPGGDLAAPVSSSGSDTALWFGAVVIVLVSAAGGAALLAFARKVASGD